MSAAPAKLIAEVIRGTCESLGYSVFHNHLPNEPDKAVVVTDTNTGRVEERGMRGSHDEHPSVQIRVRGTDSDAVEVLIEIWDHFAGISMLPLSDGRILQVISKANTIGTLGHEPQNRRCHFTQQFRMTIIPGA